MIGVGIDAVEIDRFRTVLARRPGLARRLFTPDELDYATTRHDVAQRLAVRFAAKEAVMKALGVGIGAMRFVDIEVQRHPGGAPTVRLHGGAADVAERCGVRRWHLSLTHTERTAQAVAIAE